MWLKHNIGTIIIAVVLIAIVAVIVIKVIKDKKRGKGGCASCGGGCSGCACSEYCHKKNKKQSADCFYFIYLSRKSMAHSIQPSASFPSARPTPCPPVS